MHVLTAPVRGLAEAEEAIDLGQSPADLVVLSAADAELSALAQAARALALPDDTLRLANWMALSHPYSVDLYAEKTLARAKLVVVRLLGGTAYWSYGVERLRALARGGAFELALLPGEAEWNAGLAEESTLDATTCRRLWEYLAQGGAENYRGFLGFARHLVGHGDAPEEARPLPSFGELTFSDQGPEGIGSAAVIVYRSIVQAGQTAPVEALGRALGREGVRARCHYVSSLKSDADAAYLREVFAADPPDVVLNGTAFALSRAGEGAETVLDGGERPVLQFALSGASRTAWEESTRGLSAKDLSMHVALPELDGRIFTRAVSFKESGERDPLTQFSPVRYAPAGDRVAFVASQARRLLDLRRTPPGEKRVAIVLSNYPNRDGRLANGVGLDAPASAIGLIEAMRTRGYAGDGAPASSEALMDLLLAGPTNDLSRRRRGGETLDLEAYRSFFSTLPTTVRDEVTERWGAPESDPMVEDGAFRLAIHRFGNFWIGVQPARGYNIDPKATYHDPDLVPPHGYLAFHAFLRREARVHAIVHMGKHGNLEWLPGKALALSEACYPEAVLGPVPLVYPFIVNDPGEGSQAKRRGSAVIVDHLMPPMARAESGRAGELERLLDEYAEAQGMDPRRLEALREEIVATVSTQGLDRDLGVDLRSDEALAQLDEHLCDLKELQIRDGLHVLGESPKERQRIETLVALARVPSTGSDDSLHRAIAADLDLGFDPIDCAFAEPWTGPRPAELDVHDEPWRIVGDTVERIERLAERLVETARAPETMPRTHAALERLLGQVAPALDGSGKAEIAATLTALAGRFVAPGPSGAPTRGRADVLPTGRNFYSVDGRAVPTPTAWTLGCKSAQLVCERHFREEGEWPRCLALTAWGTSNMRTGGDDIAQALAFLGAKPVWEKASGRVTGIETIPLSELGRPRVDVTLRISGFFRDAFPTQIVLFQQAVDAVADEDEPGEANPIRAAVREEEARLRHLPGDLARRRARHRVFGSMPGAYGAGLQALIDEGGWSGRRDLADAFLAWSGFAYDARSEGDEARTLLANRLRVVEAVVQNQDNREHDLLDSDDYYQFEGGLAASVEALSGRAPAIYHNDHSRPERPVARRLDEEISRVVRGRAANPKWIAGMMRHGYKGGFELAATVDYLFAFAATTNAVSDHHFDQLYEAYIEDEAVRAFLEEANAPALAEMTARFREAVERGLWTPRRNSVMALLLDEGRAA